MNKSSLFAAALAIVSLTACNQNGAPGSGVMNGGSVNKQDVGTVAGAVGGGVLGSLVGKGNGKIAGTIVGGLLGAGLGNQIGKSLDNADMAAYNSASQHALETAQPGQSMPWSGHNATGTVTPSNYYQNSSGQYCREYSQTIVVGGQKQQGYGTACRQPDGTWEVVSNN